MKIKFFIFLFFLIFTNHAVAFNHNNQTKISIDQQMSNDDEKEAVIESKEYKPNLKKIKIKTSKNNQTNSNNDDKKAIVESKEYKPEIKKTKNQQKKSKKYKPEIKIIKAEESKKQPPSNADKKATSEFKKINADIKCIKTSKTKYHPNIDDNKEIIISPKDCDSTSEPTKQKKQTTADNKK